MTTTVLAYIPSPPQGVWYLGPIPLRAYALCIIAGIIVALILGDRRWQARGGEAGVIYDIALWAVPFGLVGGRLYHVITDWPTYFGEDGAGFGAALRIWDGGLGIWGAVALGGIGAWIACRRRGIPLPAFGDAIAPGIVLAQAIGRLGNYFNQELYGRETTVPWGLEIFNRRDPSGYISVHSLDGISVGPPAAAIVHPTFLYELLWNVFVFAVLILVDKRFKIGHGRLFALYVAGYCVGRFWVELLRSDTATLIAGIRVNSFTSTLVFIGAVVYIMVAPRGREDPATLGKPLDDKDESVVDELAEQLTAVAATTGIVAAATVADREEAEDSVDSEEPVEAPTEAEVLDAEVPELVVPAGVEPEDEAEPVSVGDSGAVEDAVAAESSDAGEVVEPEAVAAESSDADEVGEPEDAEAVEDDAAVDSEDEAEPVSVGDSGAVEEAVAAESSDADEVVEPEAVAAESSDADEVVEPGAVAAETPDIDEDAEPEDAEAVEDDAAVDTEDEVEPVSVGDSGAVEEAIAAESSDTDEVGEPEDAEAVEDDAAVDSEDEAEPVSVGDSGAVEEAVASEPGEGAAPTEAEVLDAEVPELVVPAGVEPDGEAEPVSVGDSGAVEEAVAAESSDTDVVSEPEDAEAEADDAADAENEAEPVSDADSGAVEESVAAEDTEEPAAETVSTENETSEPLAAETPAQPTPAPREGRLRRLLRRRR